MIPPKTVLALSLLDVGVREPVSSFNDLDTTRRISCCGRGGRGNSSSGAVEVSEMLAGSTDISEVSA